MPDESEVRGFNLEEAIQCTLENHPSSGASNALESTGYLWQAYWSQLTRSPEWNMSWVTENDASGWTKVRQSESHASLLRTVSMTPGHPHGTGTRSQTHTLCLLLEGRLLDDFRYSDLNNMIEGGQGSWFTDVELGYLFTSTQDDLLPLPGGIGDGRVAFY